MENFFIVLGVALAGYALRTFSLPLARRAGALLYFAATYAAGLFIFKTHLGGIAALALWFVVPLAEILIRARRLRLPLDKEFTSRIAPPRENFPHLPSLTEELENSGFERADDMGWDWEEIYQFVRIFLHPTLKMQATIHFDQQGRLGLTFVSIVSRTTEGRTYTTSNHPFSQTLRPPPEARLNRLPSAESFEQLLEAHRLFLLESGVVDSALLTPNPELLGETLSRDLRQRVDHNLSEGILLLGGDGFFRYSWRGCLFLYAQSVKDMMRLI